MTEDVNVLLADAVWPELTDRPLVLVPVGSTEQHGPHLPFDTDTVIADAVARRAAERLPRAVVAPALAYGSSGEHQSFPGTSSIGGQVLRATIVELVRSMSTWSQRVVLVNGHGGNVGALSSAVQQMVDEGHDVAWVPCATEDVDLHAGLTETSLMLHLRPDSVRLDQAEVGDTRPLADIIGQLVAGGVAAVSPNGVLGDPTRADVALGRRVLEDMVEQTVTAVIGGVVDPRGRLRHPLEVA
ncbi:MAG: mycofactocin biosynthesis peptidyl-dipeptidase MftE [Aeromicrobium sp.]|uniref:mycofactocin biosynthesis peptidyl-dipeptidase MftE n=1 Tax=Aeromicrobium sp. TaxID=1871063 RepID=UPI00262AA9EC|nr:mycofactocin biosynthesis peptidyl-dipeptidase MftE [Aeromicrobium sp.]MDF1706137.1 mycofactocin biosynthesis peptidyl-dipeptidase MftE [Aeromicrobium sp.]